MSKIRVAVLRGGPSSEYEVSLKTGGTMLKHLQSARMNEKYEPHDVLITRDGIWHLDGFEMSPEQIVRRMDVVLNGLHGQFGEDGKVQQILDSLDAKYTGSGALASALAMKKHFTKEVARRHEIKTPLHLIVRANERTPEHMIHIFRTFPHPAVVKPVAAGSSVGVSIAYTLSDLVAAVEEALRHSDTALIEEYISGREATCGVIDNFRGERHYTLPVVEIIPAGKTGKKSTEQSAQKSDTSAKPAKDAFFDYESKYSGESSEICPGNFTEAERKTIQDAARKIHQALDLRHYSRSDFIVSPRRGIYFLEANTLPGMTNESLFPKSLAAVGADVPSFLDHLLSLALER